MDRRKNADTLWEAEKIKDKNDTAGLQILRKMAH
jgi:hypothetical protein